MWGKDPDVPHELTYSEIKSTIRDFANAAKNAIIAGFDGIYTVSVGCFKSES